jgi:hypothetical protein
VSQVEDEALRLEVDDPDHWRRQFSDPAGRYLADLPFALDRAEANYHAFVALDGYLDRHASPDQGLEHEGSLLEEVGAWLGERVLGLVAKAVVDTEVP